MKKLEFKANSHDEAKVHAYKEGVTILFNATRDWIRRGKPLLTKDMEQYAAKFMSNRDMFGVQNAGILICVKTAIAALRKNPYKLINNIRSGRIKLKKEIQIRTKADDKVIGVAQTKNEAKALAKELMREYMEDLYAKAIYSPEENEFELIYKPSKYARAGQYVVFYSDEGDVRLHNKVKKGIGDI